jgi:hypothetical protein
MMFISDFDNNRIVGFPLGSFTATFLIGQTTFTSNSAATTASGLSGPWGLAFDSQDGVYVGDRANNRVVYFVSGSTTATLVYGQGGNFISGESGRSASTLNRPQGGNGNSGLPSCFPELTHLLEVALLSDGALAIADQFNSRTVVYSPARNTNAATLVYGQPDLVSRVSLSNPIGVAVDIAGSLLLFPILFLL